MRRLLLLVLLAAIFAPAASASPSIRYGIQDDAWLQYGPGTLDDRLDRLDALGVDVVRVTLDWRATEPTKAGIDDWERADLLLDGLHERGIAPLVTLWGTPAWANGHKPENVAPTSSSTFAAFARRVALRYPYVKLWAVWNEPNQRRWLLPTSPSVYVKRLLNPAVAAIHAASPGSKVAGGVTAPRGSTGGVSPVDWIAGMAAAHAQLDAYAHNPYPLAPGETPTSGGCDHCTTITMATLPRLLREVGTAWPGKRIWLTEYAYQTNPPDRFWGVSFSRQAQLLGQAALRAYKAPRVDMLIHYLVRDEPTLGGWQSGLFTFAMRAKPAARTFSMPLAVAGRSGGAVVVWGQVRAGSGPQGYRIQVKRPGSGWTWAGGTRTTSARGFVSVRLTLPKRSSIRLWSADERVYGLSVPVAV